MKQHTFPIVGLSGASQQGKSTVAHMLHTLAGSSLDLETSDQVMLVANRWLTQRPPFMGTDVQTWLHSWVQRLELVVQEIDPYAWALTEATDSKLNQPLHEYVRTNTSMLADSEPITIDRTSKLEHVLLLQWLGAYVRQAFAQDFWQNMHARELQQVSPQPALTTIGGIRFKDDAEFVHSLGGVVVRVVKTNMPKSKNIVDLDIEAWAPDVLLLNNGSLQQLEVCVKRLWQELSSNKLGRQAPLVLYAKAPTLADKPETGLE